MNSHYPLIVMGRLKTVGVTNYWKPTNEGRRNIPTPAQSRKVFFGESELP